MSFFKGIFKAVIFDLDGVIIDSEPIHMQVMNSICRQWGAPHTWEEYAGYMGKSDVAIWSEVKERYHVQADVDDLIKHYSEKLSEYFRASHDIPIVKGVAHLLKELRQEGILCAVGSASSRVNITLALNHLENSDYFEAIVSGDDVSHGKPSPDIFLMAAKQLKIAPKECAVIEDAVLGVQAARNAGMYCIGFKNPTSGEQDLSKADKIIYDMAELIAGENA